MSRGKRELDRLRADAWRDLGSDLRRTGGDAGRVGPALAKKYPWALMGGGALLVALVFRRMLGRRTDVEAPKRRRILALLLKTGGAWVVRAVTSALGRKPERLKRTRAAAGS